MWQRGSGLSEQPKVQDASLVRRKNNVAGPTCGLIKCGWNEVWLVSPGKPPLKMDVPTKAPPAAD
jgi:hypothetical protein